MAWKDAFKSINDWAERGQEQQRRQHCPPLLECPYCHTVGQVWVEHDKRKSGISGGKATAAVLTMGVSMLGTGLSRKRPVNQLRCLVCGMEWITDR